MYSLTGVAYGVARTHSGFVDPSSFLEKDAKFICVPLFSSRNTQSLSAYPCFLREIRKVYLRTLVSPEKSGPVYLRTLIFLEKKACLDG